MRPARISGRSAVEVGSLRRIQDQFLREELHWLVIITSLVTEHVIEHFIGLQLLRIAWSLGTDLATEVS